MKGHKVVGCLIAYWLRRAAQIADSLMRIAVVIAFTTMVGLVLVAVVARNTPVSLPFRVTGVEEGARYLMIFYIFMCLGVAYQSNMLAGISAFLVLLPARIQRLVGILRTLIMLGFLGAMVYFGQDIILHQIRTGQRSPNLRFPMYLAYLPILIGCGLAIFYVARSLRATTESKESDKEHLGPPVS